MRCIVPRFGSELYSMILMLGLCCKNIARNAMDVQPSFLLRLGGHSKEAG